MQMTAQQRQTPDANTVETSAAPVPDQGPLIVWSADPAASEPLLRALEQVRELDLRPGLPAPVAAAPALPEMLLLCHAPDETLCRAMAAGVAPGAALERWMDQTRALLALNRHDRRRTHILDIARAGRDPGAVLGRFGLPADSAPVAAPEASDQVLLLLAMRCVAQNPQARALAGELEAAAVGVGASAGDADAAFRAYRQAHEQAATRQAETAAAQAELAALRDQQDQLRQTLAAAETAQQAARQEVDLLQDRNRAAQGTLEELGRERAELDEQLSWARAEQQTARQEAEILQAQTALMRNELAALERGREQLEQRLAQLGQGIESQQAQIAALEAERDALKRRTAGKDRALEQAGGTLRDLEAQVAEMIATLGRVREDRAGMARLAAEQRQRATALADRLRELETSRSYRLTAPLRRLRALISGKGRA